MADHINSLLADLVQVDQRILQFLADGRHTTQSGDLQLPALVQRLAVLEKTDIVSRDGLNQVLRGRNLTEGNLEVVGIVKCVKKILVERMQIENSGERREDGLELFGEAGL